MARKKSPVLLATLYTHTTHTGQYHSNINEASLRPNNKYLQLYEAEKPFKKEQKMVSSATVSK